MRNIFWGSCFLLFLFSGHSPAQGTWTAKANFPGSARNTAVAFEIGTKGYFGTGFAGLFMPDFWEYNPATNVWTQKASFGGGDRGFAVGFSIGNFGYLGTGREISGMFKDFWRYNPVTNTWAQMANFGGTARITASGFSINGKGYIGTGNDGAGQTKDFWRYDPATNAWTKMGDFLGGTRADVDRATFVIGSFAYWGTGANGWNDLWQYNPATDVWTQKANFPGGNRYGATGFTLCDNGFLGLGNDGGSIYYNDYWKYDPVANSWSAVTALPAAARCDAPAFVINNKAYLGTGYSGAFLNDWWEFSMGTSSVITAVATTTAICSGSSVTLTASGGNAYLWSTGHTDASITVSPTATTVYTVTDTTSACVSGGSVSVAVLAQPTVTISGGTTVCGGGAATLSATGGGSYAWSTGATGSSITVSPVATTSYSVSVTNSCGTSSASASVTVVSKATAVISCQDVCSGNTATLTASGGGDYSWSTGSTGSSIFTTTPGTYSVIVSIGGGCSDTASCSVNISSNPVADAGADVTIQNGSTAVLTASGGVNYAWSNGNSGAVISVSPPATSTYTVLVVDANGCSAVDSVTVFVDGEPFDCSFSSDNEFVIPNAFSPNGDDENETLKLYFKNISCITEYTFLIYNRWGEEVFKTDDPAGEWNGVYDGRTEGSALFVYYMRAVMTDGREVIKNGNVSLIR